MSSSNRDPWLNRWLGLVQERADGTPVLELGCGSGRDTATLVEAGLSVVGVDLSAGELEQARSTVTKAAFFVQDLRSPFPITSAGVVVASLSLHYFDWTETLGLVGRIHAVLRPGGILLCRLNSTKDFEYGAVGHPRIEEDFYLVEGRPKRFFRAEAVEALFSRGWHPLSVEEHVIERYTKPKVVWEVVLEKGD